MGLSRWRRKPADATVRGRGPKSRTTLLLAIGVAATLAAATLGFLEGSEALRLRRAVVAIRQLNETLSARQTALRHRNFALAARVERLRGEVAASRVDPLPFDDGAVPEPVPEEVTQGEKPENEPRAMVIVGIGPLG